MTEIELQQKEQIMILTSKNSDLQAEVRQLLLNNKELNEKLATLSESDLLLNSAAQREKKLKETIENLQTKLDVLQGKVEAAETENKKLAEEKRRADGIAQKKAFELIKSTKEELDCRTAELKIKEGDFVERQRDYDAEIDQKVASKFEKMIVEPQKDLERRQQEIDVREKKLEEDRAAYRKNLDAEYENAVEKNSVLKILLKIGVVAGGVLLAGSNYWWWLKNRETENKYSQVAGWNREYAMQNRDLRTVIEKLQTQLQAKSQPKNPDSMKKNMRPRSPKSTTPKR